MAPVRRFNPDWDIGLHKELVSQKSSSIDDESVNSKPIKSVTIKQPIVKIEPEKKIKVEHSPLPSSTPSQSVEESSAPSVAAPLTPKKLQLFKHEKAPTFESLKS